MRLTTHGGYVFNTGEYILLILIFRLSLDWVFSEVVATQYAYMGFHNRETDFYFVLSWLLLAIISIFVFYHYSNQSNSVSSEILFVLFLLSFVPFTTMVRYNAVVPGYYLWNAVYWAVLLLLLRVKADEIQYINISFGGQRFDSNFKVKLIAIIFAAVVVFISWRYTHFRLNFNLLNVYDIRAEAASFSMPLILRYLFSWTRVINALILAYFIRKKDWIWAVGCFFVQLLNFGIDGSKTTLFLAIMAMIICLLPISDLREFNKWILRGFALLPAICMAIYNIFDNIVPLSLFVRRVMFLPQHIAGLYYDFFTTHTPDYFTQSFMRYFGFVSHYDKPIARMIAEVYEQQNSSFNNGLISDGMANLGLYGVIIMPIILAIVLKWFDDRRGTIDARIAITTALYSAIILSNSFLFTDLFTHGLLVAILLLGLMREDSQYNCRADNRSV